MGGIILVIGASLRLLCVGQASIHDAKLTPHDRMQRINALDAERANFESTLRGLELLVGPTLAPLELPIGEGANFQGVVDLLADEAITYDASGPRRGPVPAELADLEARVRSSLLEAIVVSDDTLTERYLEGDIPSMEELEPALSELMIAGRIVPVTCGSHYE